mgnify:CR=1 FL=1
MNISELSIRRPVLATVLTIIILLFGFIGYNYLGVREYPSVDNQIISVSCSYPGANADVGTEYQRYSRYPFLVQCESTGT